MFSSGLSTIKLICHCLVVSDLDDAGLSKLIKSLSSRNFEWGKFCHIAGRNWLLSYLHYVLDQEDLLELVPEEVQTEILAVSQLTKSRNQRIKHQLEQIIYVLNLNNIQPLLLKGASYLMRPVSQIQEFRMISDIDLLIPEPSLKPAVDALNSEGYRFSNFLPDGTNYHLDPMTKEGMPARLELHTKPLAAECIELISAVSAWKNADLIQKDEQSYYLFNPEYRLIHQFAHAQIHSRDYANNRIDLRQLFDFYLMCKIYSKTINWSFVDTLFSAHHRNIWMDYVFTAKLVFSNLDKLPVSNTVGQHTQARMVLAKSSGDYNQVYIYHWLGRLTRLPQRLISPDWYTSKFKYLFNK